MTNRIVSHIENKVADNSWTIDDIQQYLSIEIEELISDRDQYKQGLERANRYNIDKLTPELLKELHRIRKELLSNIQAIETDIKFLRMLSLEAPKMIKKISLHEQFSSIQPIHWLKGEESLRQFLQSIKKKGLIENRDTEEIIQEHFYVDGKMPTKEPQPIKWMIESQYLAYMMHRLADEFIINIKGKKHQLTASHFISSDDNPLNTNSLSSQLSNMLRHGKSTDKNLSTIENIIQQVKS